MHAASQDDTRGPATAPQLPAGSFAEIYAQHSGFVWRNARRLGVDASSAEDVVQEVFIVLQRRLPDFDGRTALRSWIFGILVRVVRHYHRRFQRKDARCVPLERAGTQEHGGGAGGIAPDQHAENAERVRLLETLLGQLDEDKRTLLVLSELEEWTLREIAEFLGSNTNTVHSRLRAAKRAFEELHRRWLAEQGDPP
jgi:RNA polymerase sigma-70 factor (ECF subfamily)